MSKVTQLVEVEPAFGQKDLTQVHAPDRDATSCAYVLRGSAASALAADSSTTEPPGGPCAYMHAQ